MKSVGQKLRNGCFELLKSVQYFKSLSDEKIKRILDHFDEEFYHPGQYIMRQGEICDTFYIISQGTVKITKNTKRQKVSRQSLCALLIPKA